MKRSSGEGSAQYNWFGREGVIASFFGAPNLLDATVLTVEPAANLSRLAVRGESWQGVAYGNQRFAPGDRVRILVRPEDIWPEVMQNEVDAAWRGEVLESVFRGARRTLRVRTQAGELRIEVPALAHPEVGETIEIGAARFALWAFAGPESKALGYRGNERTGLLKQLKLIVFLGRQAVA